MTNGTLVALGVGATGLLVLGARLLEDPTTTALLLGVIALLLGTALAATAVAGAWRSPGTRRDAEPAEPSDAAMAPLRRR